MKVTVKLTDVIAHLEGCATNTDTDPYWLAATELRRVQHGDLTEWVIDGTVAQPSLIAEAGS